MAKRFYIEQYSQADSNSLYVVEIYDSTYEGETALLLEGGFTLKYDEAKPGDLLEPIFPSVASITVHVNASDEDFEDFIDGFTLQDDESVQVVIKREGVQIWQGMVPTDLISYPDVYYPYDVTIDAICGLTKLKNVKYNNDGVNYSGRATVLQHLKNIVAKLNYPSSADSLLPIIRVTGFRWEENNWPSGSSISGLELVDLAYESFQTYDEFGILVADYCYDVLEKILRQFHLRIFMAKDAFMVQQITNISYVDIYTYNNFSGTPVLENVLITSAFTDNRNDGHWTNYPPAKEVNLIYNYNQGTNDGNLVPPNYTLGNEIALTDIAGGNNEVVRLVLNLSVFVYILAEYDWFIRFRMRLKVGDYYLTGQAGVLGNEGPEWSLTDGYFYLDTGIINQPQLYPFSFDVVSPPIPAGGDGTFELEFVDTYVSETETIDLLTGTYEYFIDSLLLIMVFNNNTLSKGRIKFTALNTSDGSTLITSGVVDDMPDTDIGCGPYASSVGKLRAYNGTEWQESDSWSPFNGPQGMNINKLRVQELMVLKKNGLKAFEFTLQSYCAFFNYPTTVADAKKYLIMGYELDPDVDEVKLSTLYVNVDRNNIVLNDELQAETNAGGSTGGNGYPTQQTHNRQHSMTNPLDHAPAGTEDFDKLIGTNAETGAIEYVSKSSIGGSGTDLTIITYAELITLISSSGLTPGAKYLISDFATVHYFINLNEDTSLYTRISGAINTGSTEPIIVTATAVNKLSADAKSTVYPTDRMLYDWNPDNWLSDISFGYDGSIVSGFKGVIYYRHDTIQNNELQYDFRNVKFRRWKINLSAWSSATTYAKGATVMYGGFAYYSLRGSNLNNTPGSSPSQWACFNEDYFPGSAYDYMCVNSSVYGNYSIYSGDDAYYQDFFTFENYDNVFEYHAINNQPVIYQFGSYTPIGIGSILTGVVWFMPFDTSVLYNVHITGWYEMCSIITESIRDVNVKDFKWNIGTLATVQNVSCKESFAYNQFMGGQISMLNCNSFYGNDLSGTIQCKLGGEINNNVIAGFCSFYSIGRFTANNLYYNISFMTFGAGRITSCTLAVHMYNIQGECHSQDFTGATQVSNSNRTNTLQRTGASTNVLIYYSGTTQYIVAANA